MACFKLAPIQALGSYKSYPEAVQGPEVIWPVLGIGQVHKARPTSFNTVNTQLDTKLVNKKHLCLHLLVSNP